MSAVAHLRIARPVSDLARAAAMYREGLGLRELARFEDHAGFDGVMLGYDGAGWHLEFTHCRAHPVVPAPTATGSCCSKPRGAHEPDRPAPGRGTVIP